MSGHEFLSNSHKIELFFIKSNLRHLVFYFIRKQNKCVLNVHPQGGCFAFICDSLPTLAMVSFICAIRPPNLGFAINDTQNPYEDTIHVSKEVGYDEHNLHHN